MRTEGTDDEGIRARTARRLVALESDARALDARDAELSRLRGVSFLVFGGLSLFGLFRPTLPVGTAAGIAALGFAVFVVRHARVATAQFELARRIELVRRSLARAEGTFRAPDSEAHRRGDAFLTQGHPYASDLDIFGKRSLFELCNVSYTPAGEARLASWLSAPADAEAIRARQLAVRELASDEVFRENLALAGMRAAKSSPLRDQRGVLAWAIAEPVSIPALQVALLLLAQLGLGVAAALGHSAATRAWGLAVLLQIVVVTMLRGRLEAVLGAVAVKQAPLGGYPDAMALCERQAPTAPALKAPHQRLVADGGAAKALAKLDNLLGFAAVRHNGLVHVLANVFLMWDVWAAARLERWRRVYGQRVHGWLDALAELEALASLGTFAAEHPTFAWPSVERGAARFVAHGLGHPLVAASKRVTNDVDLESVCALMITGSNMSGKSTMLRSVGVAAVLAQAGAPVCATSLTMSEARVWTSMRIDDSLSEGASHFFAEVRRLKAVVDAVREPNSSPVLFLLDEVLHGTNSRERILGAKAVVRHLVDAGARGAVSSHDLGLVVLEAETDRRIRNVHFQEHVHDGTMGFDYRMRPGPVATSNALRLMRQVGIDVVPEDDGERGDSAAERT
jgi:hypothetical protein